MERADRRVEAVVARDRARRSPAARPGRADLVRACRASAARRAGRPAFARSQRHTGRARSVQTVRCPFAGDHATYAIVSRVMQHQPRPPPAPPPERERRPGNRSPGGRRRRHRPPPAPPRLARLGRPRRGLRRRRRVQPLQPRPAGPEDGLREHRLRRGDDRLRPHRQGRAGPLRPRAPRDVVKFAEIPGEVVDATTAIEDKTFWENTGFDPAGVRLGRPRHAAGQRARRLDDHPAAGPQAPAARAAFADTYERKIKEIIQSVRLTQGLPRARGQAADHRHLPEPQLLRQPELRREGRGPRATSASPTSSKLTLAQAAILAGDPPVARPTYDLMRNASRCRGRSQPRRQDSPRRARPTARSSQRRELDPRS